MSHQSKEEGVLDVATKNDMNIGMVGNEYAEDEKEMMINRKDE